jgi:CheY-like chemotaxis protein/anti-sigma regulatory factor (Ser/Thr protein kinase)
MAHRAQDKGLELILDTNNAHLPMVQGDPGRIRQVLTNLVGNAIKFTNAGEVIITVSLTDHDSDITLHCAITDTGIGIPKEKQSYLFTPFTQIDASTTRQYGGTGLGLSIANQLCKQMGSEIHVESKQDSGSTFSFTINLTPSPTESPAPQDVNLTNKSILVIDDNATHRHTLVEQLRFWGASVTETENCTQAKEHLSENAKEMPTSLPSTILLSSYVADIESFTQDDLDKRFADSGSYKLILMATVAETGNEEALPSLKVDSVFSRPSTPQKLITSLNDRESPKTPAAKEKILIKDDSPNQPQTNVNTKKHRILLVEDNVINQQVAIGLLEALGFNADIAANGLEAIAALTEAPTSDPYELILMDCQMPEMDGYEATRKIRAGAAGERNNFIPIIAITANAMKGDKERCLSVGMDDYTSKPINIQEIQQKIYHWLNLQAP